LSEEQRARWAVRVACLVELDHVPEAEAEGPWRQRVNLRRGAPLAAMRLRGDGEPGILGPMERAGFRVELEREDDGRWIADVLDVPGVLAYGDTREEALDRAAALLIRVLAERLEHGELGPESREQLRRLLAA
jgi:predicted RNase H-like HicB family nuclease